MDEFDTEIKVIAVGNGQVGKTSMITRFARGVFTAEYKKTLAVDFLEKSMVLPSGDEMRFMLWDTAGQEEYDAITRTYYRGSGGAIIAFSTVDRASFDAVESWYEKISSEAGPNCVITLVQNKIDLIEDAKMTDAEVDAVARRLGLKLHRTCVKDNRNVEEVFNYLGEEFLRRGGQSAMGTRAVVDLQELSEAPAGGKNDSSGAQHGNTSAQVVSDANGLSQEDAAHLPVTLGGTVRPAVRRTDGKKKKKGFSSLFTNCSI